MVLDGRLETLWTVLLNQPSQWITAKPRLGEAYGNLSVLSQEAESDGKFSYQSSD